MTTTAEVPGAAGTRALLLPVGADRYAVGLAAVREVRAVEGITRVPGAAAVVLGLVNVRGRVVAVLDTAALLGVGVGVVGAPAAIAVVGVARGLAGLSLSAFPVAQTLGDDLGPAELEPATRRHRIHDGVVSLLDLDALLDPARLAA